MNNLLNYTILLPTSENKTNNYDEKKLYRLIKNKKEYNYFKKQLWIEREKIYFSLIEAISKLKINELEKLFEIKKEKLNEVISLNEDLLNQYSTQAINRFNGIMFKSINYNNYTNKEKEKFNNSVIFIDALFGLLKPLDYIPNYKLKINSKFLNIDIIKFWKSYLSTIIELESKNKIIIDLLPETHRKIISFKKNKNYFKIIFKENKNNTLINVGHKSKQLKGELIKYIIKKENINLEYLKKFKHTLGYTYNNIKSNENILIYSK